MAINAPVIVGSVNINGNDYPIYGTYDRALEYLAGRLDTATFDDAEQDDQNKSLVMARRWIDRQSLGGTLTSSSQITAFPRSGLIDKEGNSLADDVVPLGVEFAQYEMALLLLGDPTQFAKSNTQDNTKRLKAGEAEIEFFRSLDVASPLLFPEHILALLLPFLSSSSSNSSLGFFAGGTCEESRVKPFGTYDLWQGL